MDAVLSYCHNTLNDKSLLELLPYFSEKGVGVISASVTSMGLFTKQARATLLIFLAVSGMQSATFFRQPRHAKQHAGRDFGTVTQESKCICSPEEAGYRAVTLQVPTTP